MTKLASVVVRCDDVHKRNMNTQRDIARKLGEAAKYMGKRRSFESLRDGDKYAKDDEHTRVQINARQQLGELLDLYAEMWTWAGRRDLSNTVASADVIVDDQTILAGVPVPYLLYLEHHLGELLDVVRKLPVRDPAYQWSYDGEGEQWRAEPTREPVMEKVHEVISLHPGNEHHAPQVHLHWSDERVGTYVTTRLSGAPSVKERRVLEARIITLLDAVKSARVRANETVANNSTMGDALVAFLLPSE